MDVNGQLHAQAASSFRKQPHEHNDGWVMRPTASGIFLERIKLLPFLCVAMIYDKPLKSTTRCYVELSKISNQLVSD